MEVDVHVAGLDSSGKIDTRIRGPCTPVPHDDVAPAVLTRGDDALEVEVLERMVLDVHRHAADARIERGALGHGPTDEQTVDLESHVVVQPAGAMPLNHEALTGRRWVG